MSRKKSGTKTLISKTPGRRYDEDDSSPIRSETDITLDAIESNRKQILELQNKILAVPAMNGGFSNLMYKIERIEQSQNHLVKKVDEIREVLYDPDNGLYARIKNIENETVELEKFEVLEEKIDSIQNWKLHEEKLAQKDEMNDENLARIINEHSEVIKDLQSWYQKNIAVTKWLAITIGTAALGAIGKIIHAYVSSHVQII